MVNSILVGGPLDIFGVTNNNFGVGSTQKRYISCVIQVQSTLLEDRLGAISRARHCVPIHDTYMEGAITISFKSIVNSFQLDLTGLNWESKP